MTDEKVTTLVTVLQVGPDRIPQQWRELSSKQRELCLESPTIHSDSSWNGRPGLQRRERDQHKWEAVTGSWTWGPQYQPYSHPLMLNFQPDTNLLDTHTYIHTHTHTHTPISWLPRANDSVV